MLVARRADGQDAHRGRQPTRHRVGDARHDDTAEQTCLDQVSILDPRGEAAQGAVSQHGLEQRKPCAGGRAEDEVVDEAELASDPRQQKGQRDKGRDLHDFFNDGIERV